MVVIAEDPSVTDWMQGWGSILGLLMSTVAVFFTGWLLRHEINVRREERADVVAAQARLVIPDVRYEPHEFVAYVKADYTGKTPTVQGTVWNYSTAPIMNVGVWLCHRRTGDEIRLPHARIVVPGDRSQSGFSGPSLDQIGFDRLLSAEEQWEVRTQFVDASGVRWERRGLAEPKRVFSATSAP